MKFDSIEDAIKGIYGNSEKVVSGRTVGGGDINTAVCIQISGGESVFVKSNRNKDMDFFEAEVDGLKAIASTGTIRVPKVLAIGTDDKYGAFLMLEHIKGGSRIEGFWQVFARDLAKMHGTDTSRFVSGGKYGFLKDNYIGSREQNNTPCNNWIHFFRDCRLVPRFHDTMGYFDGNISRRITYLLDHLDKWLVEPEHPSLIHGDLWGGNFIVGNDGRAWLIDPAVYVGHAEADLAMTELFGGYSDEFYREYACVTNFSPDYRDRRDIYNLYHLLNHLASFGSSYYGAVCRIIGYYAGK